jgi:CheY-like chemotaxis protein
MNIKNRINLNNVVNPKKHSDRKISNFTHHTFIRILHIDDDLNQLLFTKRFLEEYDSKLSVESISNPTEVVDVISFDEFDCIVSDYQMGEMDGIALTKRVRKNSDIPIILYTGRGSEEVEAVARAAGANGYVQKEIDPMHYKGLYYQIINVIHKKK